MGLPRRRSGNNDSSQSQPYWITSPIDIITRILELKRRRLPRLLFVLRTHSATFIARPEHADTYTPIARQIQPHQSASAFIVSTADISRSFQLSHCISSTATEMHGLLEAILYISRQERPQQWVLLTDSLAALESLNLLGKRCINFQLQLEIGTDHWAAVRAGHSIALQ